MNLKQGGAALAGGGANQVAVDREAVEVEAPDVVVRSLPTDPPDEQTYRVEPGDRFILIDKGSQETLEREAGGHEALALRLQGDPPRYIARWMREVLVHTADEQPVVIVDAGASVTTRPPRPRVQPAVTPTMRDLLERPAEFHGRHVRLRGVYRHAMEVANFADAWFTGEWKHGFGAWVVEAEGLWVHGGNEYGHLGYYKSELRGTLTMVDVSRARPISPDRIRFARRYVPLSAEVVLERRLRGWTHDGQWVTRLGGDAMLPAPDLPERFRARVKFSVGMSGNLGIFTWQLLDAEPLTPERATVDAPGRRGRYIEIEGRLVPTHRYPRLDAVLDVCPPSLLHTFSIPEPEVVERIRSCLGAGRHVTIRGEMDERLWSTLRPTIAFNEGGDPPALPTVAEAVGRHGESGLVRTLAARDGVEVHSLEPSYEAQVTTLRANYTAEQIKLFYALRQMEQSYRQRSDRSPAATLDHVLRGLSAIPGLAGAPQNYEQYIHACQRLLPATPDCMRPPASWLDPADTGVYTNTMSAALARERDEHMVALLHSALRPGARVFAVVGSSHVFMQEQALRRALAARPTRL